MEICNCLIYALDPPALITAKNNFEQFSAKLTNPCLKVEMAASGFRVEINFSPTRKALTIL